MKDECPLQYGCTNLNKENADIYSSNTLVQFFANVGGLEGEIKEEMEREIKEKAGQERQVTGVLGRIIQEEQVWN